MSDNFNSWNPGRMIAAASLACLVAGTALAGPRDGGLSFDGMSTFDPDDVGGISSKLFIDLRAVLDEALVERVDRADVYLVRSEDSLFALFVFGDGPYLAGIDGLYEGGAVVEAAVERCLEGGGGELTAVLGTDGGEQWMFLVDPRGDNPYGSSYAVGTLVNAWLDDDDPVASSYAVGFVIEENERVRGDLDPMPLYTVDHSLGDGLELVATDDSQSVDVHGALFELPPDTI